MMDIHAIYRPFLRHFRTGRVTRFYKALSVNQGTSVVDIGGNGFIWALAKELGLPQPKQVTILNIYERDEELPDWIQWVCADARQTQFETGSFDVAFSNSVIEHLGGHDSQAAMAAEIRRIAKRYWVQTPDPRFPVEPHYLTPFVHWLPKRARKSVLRNGTLWGLVARPSREQVETSVEEIRLIPLPEFRAMFPDGRIVLERFAGVPKSMIAVKA